MSPVYRLLLVHLHIPIGGQSSEMMNHVGGHGVNSVYCDIVGGYIRLFFF